MSKLYCDDVSYAEAKPHKPRGSCYCDLSDEDCYRAGHWANYPKRKKR